MHVSFANPDRLDTFVADAPGGRLAAADLAQRGASLATGVMSRSAGGALRSNFGAVSTLLENMAADEQFVRGVADALGTAGRHDGIASMNDVAIRAQLVDGTYDTRASRSRSTRWLCSAAPTSGLVTTHLRRQRQLHRPRSRPRLPRYLGGAQRPRFFNSLAADRIGASGAGWTSVFDVWLELFGAKTEPGASGPNSPTGPP